MTRAHRLWGVWAGFTLLAGVTAPLQAQYFGRNKVQYEDLKFSVLKTEHFDIYYYPQEKPAIELAALMSERWYARLSRILNHDLSNRQVIIFYANGAHFRQTNVLQGDISEATGGVTEVLKRRMVLPFAGPLAETDHVLGHEMVHAFQYDMTGEGGGVLVQGAPSVLRMPLWFVEGMAEYLSLGPVDPNTAMWMRDAVRKELPDVKKLQDPRFFPYRYGQALVAYMAGRWGEDVCGRLLKASRTARGGLEPAFARVLREPIDSVVSDWHRAMRQYYAQLRPATDTSSVAGLPPIPSPALTQAASSEARLIIGPHTAGNLNIAPALSPDGKDVMFYSEKDLFSINLYLADAETGRIKKRIVETAVDPHFESIEFISSAGSWDFEGQRFAFTGLTKGRPVLSIYDVARDKLVDEIKLPELGEIYNPSWSPDGRQIVFSAQVGGLLDLFLYDLDGGTLKRLTDDAYADLQPVWSSDGSRIAFVTDRFTTGLSSLLYGDYRIALLDPQTGAITEVRGFDRGKEINPQWGPDGSLYFISDRNGISDVYRRDMETGEITQVTNLYTGVSGIVGLSPAMSVAVKSGRMAMSVFENDRHVIYAIDDSTTLRGEPVRAEFAINPALLPPADRMSSELTGLLHNAFFGLPADSTFSSHPYGMKMTLDYIGQPSLAFGADRFGAFIYGGASAYWSDILGNHNIASALYFNGSFSQMGGLLSYINLSRRLNWGAALQQTPYRQFFLLRDTITNQGSSLQEDLADFRQVVRSASVSFAYPLNQVQRLEFQTGYQGVFYDVRQFSALYTANGALLQDTTFKLPPCATQVFSAFCTPSAIHLAQASGAVVYDNSLFGFTGPIVGQRYRFEAGANIGSLNFYTGLADYRKYWMPVRPFTVAFRVMHFGRYGRDADSPILSPIYIGYDGLVRGYSFNQSDLFNECDSACSIYTQLFGSKVLVGNVELRAPLLGALGLGKGIADFLPLELVAFGDAGLAWWGRQLPSDFSQLSQQDQQSWTNYVNSQKPFFLSGGTRKPVFSAGGGVRANIFGAIVLSVYYVHPFNRPQKSGYIQFSVTPGF